MGWGSLYLPENDRRPVDAVHDWNGVFVIHDPEGTIGDGFKGILSIENVASTLRELMLSK